MNDRTAVLEHAVLSSFMMELQALKPGNVSRSSPGHGMTAKHFETSALLTAPILCNADLALGQRVLASVAATRDAVGCNTNLGMLLLFAPLICAAEMGTAPLHANLQKTLAAAERRDLEDLYAAIKLAEPGGLGASDKYDVHRPLPVDATLQQAMQYAGGKDVIAR